MATLFGGFYAGKTVLVTGHTGFKGSWLSIWLKELGAKVVGYALDQGGAKDNFVLAGLKDCMVDLRGDVRDFPKLVSALEAHEPDVVFHLAAQALVRPSYESPRETFEQNVMGTVNVLEGIRRLRHPVTCIVVTSDKCYRNEEWVWGYREQDPLGGHDPYSASKGCAELVTGAYLQSFFNPERVAMHGKSVASARAGNVIGGGDWAKDRIVPDCIRALEAGKAIEVRNPRARRPWQHVLEPLSGYLWLAANLARDARAFSGAWNFGPAPESVVSVEDLVKMVLARYGNGSWVDTSDPDQPHEAQLLNLDCSKAHHRLNWRPSLRIEQCIELTVDWYRSYARRNAYDLCLEQIGRYRDEAKRVGNRWAE